MIVKVMAHFRAGEIAGGSGAGGVTRILFAGQHARGLAPN